MCVIECIAGKVLHLRVCACVYTELFCTVIASVRVLFCFIGRDYCVCFLGLLVCVFG